MASHTSTAGRPSSEMCTRGGLRRRPAHGSVTLSARASQPQPLVAWAQFLTADLGSVKRARDWTALFLECCQVLPVPDTDTTVLVVSELVTNAITAMQIAMASETFTGFDRVELSLRLFPDHLLVEVIDSSKEVPAPKFQEDTEAPNGRGFTLVDALSELWGWHWHLKGSRKVVWAELAVESDEETDEA
jgi:anti-sigma regulatory factor (Ser/Thr protein kinase)